MNRMKRISCSALVFGILCLLNTSILHAQVTKEQLDAARAHLRAAETLYDKMPDEHRRILSGGALNFFHVIKTWPEIQRKVLAAHGSLGSQAPLGLSSPSGLSLVNVPSLLGPVQVSNPEKDFHFGPDSGFTQSETSTAWCGQNVNAGYNDSDSFFESLFSSPNAQSFNGWGHSTNQGQSYTDMGFLHSAIPGDMFDFLEGDPALGCANATRLFYGSLLFRVDGSGNPLSSISVSISTDGGVSFGPPVPAVSKSAFTHFLDKDQFAVDPKNPNHLAVVYTDFDVSFTTGCPTSERVAVEVVESSDGGNSYGPPFVVFQICSGPPNFPFVQGGQVAFSPSGNVDAALEGFFGPPIGRQIGFASAPFGSAFGGVGLVANITGVGDGFAIQGGIRTFLDIQTMAVDHSSAPTKGTIYIAYHDSTNFQKNFNGVVYGYSDAMLAKSSNGGATWSTVQVNNNTEPLSNGLGIDSYQPGVGVDETGRVGVCWYDRRNDPLNFRTDRFCGVSSNAGATFTNVRVTPSSFSPFHGIDNLVNPFYDGDYDTVATDGLGTTSGFIGAFHIVRPEGPNSPVPNADVKAFNFN